MSSHVVHRDRCAIDWSPELLQAVYGARDAGDSIGAIAERYGISERQVYRKLAVAAEAPPVISQAARVEAIQRDADAGATVAELAERYETSQRRVKAVLGRWRETDEVPEAVPGPLVRACGCYRGHPCKVARELAAAMQTQRWGSREWAIARQALIRHQAGE